jgi:hypothetical protein
VEFETTKFTRLRFSMAARCRTTAGRWGRSLWRRFSRSVPWEQPILLWPQAHALADPPLLSANRDKFDDRL